MIKYTAYVAGVPYELAVGQSVNLVSKALAGDELTDNEEEWAERHKCAPPYLLVHFGPTAMHSVSDGYVMHEAGGLVTYNAFANARSELAQMATKALPSIETAVACVFSTESHRVVFRPIERTTFGLTGANVLVRDLLLGGSLEGYGSRLFTTHDIRAGLEAAGNFASSVDPRVSEFFQLALHEHDALKRFLYFFLAIEIEVHRTFKKVTRAEHIRNAATLNPRLAVSVASLLEKQEENWRNLAARFVWCATSVWTHLSDEDVAEFRRLKKVRDGIAHGDISAPDPGAVAAVEALARKLQRPAVGDQASETVC